MFLQNAEAMENAVGQLQELATKRGWAPPQYDSMGFTGRPNERVFATRCTMQERTAIGYGARKQLSKQRAAQQVLVQLQ
jgi:dsRNA-specific ribonuclease